MAITLEELQIKFNADMGNLNGELKDIKQAMGGVEAPTGKATSAMANFAKIGKMIGGWHRRETNQHWQRIYPDGE